MAKTIQAAGLIARRYGAALLLVGPLLVLGWLANAGAQSPADKGDPGKQPAAKKDKDGLFDDAEIDEAKTKPNRHGPPPVVDLKQASRDPKLHAVVRDLFATLAVPHDKIMYRHGDGSSQPFRASGFSDIMPLEKYYGDKVPRDALKDVMEFQKDGSLKKIDPTTTPIQSIVPYEKLAHDEVATFRRRDLSEFSPPLPRYNQAVAAEQALYNVLSWHESKRGTGVRVGSEWDALVADLRKQLLRVLLDELKELTEAHDWDGAFALTQRLSENYPDDAELAVPFATLIKQSLTSPLDPTLRQKTRQRLEQLSEKYPNNTAITDIVNELKKKAQELYNEAQAKEKSADPKVQAEAPGLVDRALETWPNLPGLAGYKGRMRTKFPILRVGVRELPKYLSPGMACTDSEHRVVEFLFESLVKLSPDAAGLGHYHPGLAVGRPEVISLGRQFQLPENAYWPNGDEINVKDIAQTVAQLKKGRGNGQSAAVGELFAENQPVSGARPRVSVKLSQGYVEPLSLMTFKILPRREVLPKANQRAVDPEQAPFGYDEKAFAENPVGSGPFMFMPGGHSEKGRAYLLFALNPLYGDRPNKRGLPRFQEVRLFAYSDAVTEVKTNKLLDVLLDLTADEAGKLKDLGSTSGFRVMLPEPNTTIPNRRVYFLAINHRRADLQNVKLRRALVKAIDREKLLDLHFRGPLKQQVHKALNGPYPAGSWANNSDVPHGVHKNSLDPFDPDGAASKLDELTRDAQRYRPPTLSLKYPSGDSAVKAAMTSLAAQIEKNLPGVKITPDEVSPWALRDAVEKTHDFDLAYYHYDFPDDTNSLWPLFGGDENYFGFPTVDMTGPLSNSIHFCDFEQVRKSARQLHQSFDLQVPLIPLWQLDPLLAVHDDVKTVPFDRNLVFTDIEQWRLEGKKRE